MAWVVLLSNGNLMVEGQHLLWYMYKADAVQ